MSKLFDERRGRGLCCLLLPIALLALLCPDILSSAATETGVGTGFIYDAIYLKHNTGAGHPECPERLTAILDRLEQKGVLQHLVRLRPQQPILRLGPVRLLFPHLAAGQLESHFANPFVTPAEDGAQFPV